MRALFIFLMFCLALTTSAQERILEKLYVLNAHGSAMYQSPSFDSPVLGLARPGSTIEVLERVATGQQRKAGEGLSFKGDFIRISIGLLYAYVFSSDLTNKPVTTNTIDDEFSVPTLLGKKLAKKEVKRTATFGDKSYELTDEVTTYQYGSYTYTPFDGCFDHVYVLKGLTLQEVYHQLRNMHIITVGTGEGSYIELPWFVDKKGNRYNFGVDGATQELHILENADGSYTISSYDCT